MRKAYLLRQREKSFDITYHINDKPLPTYNALEDPYLEGFFSKPQFKRHLQKNGIIKRRKRKSHFNLDNERPKTTSKSNRIYERNERSPKTRFPVIEDAREIKTAGEKNRKGKSLFHSKKNSDLL